MAAPESTSWRNGLFGQVCGGSCSTCLGAWFCTPCLHGRVSSRAKAYPELTSNSQITTLNSDCFLATFAGCFGLTFIPIMLKRGEVREKFGIAGNPIKDCFLSCCCQPCALAQMSTELKERTGPIALLPTENNGRRGYVSPGAANGMVYSDDDEEHRPAQQQGKAGARPPAYTDDE